MEKWKHTHSIHEGNIYAVAEIELRNIAVKVLLAAMLINALHAAFEDAVEPLKRVGVNVASHIFASAVRDKFMAREFFA